MHENLDAATALEAHRVPHGHGHLAGHGAYTTSFSGQIAHPLPSTSPLKTGSGTSAILMAFPETGAHSAKSEACAVIAAGVAEAQAQPRRPS